MTKAISQINSEDVLSAFAMEPNQDSSTLEHYLRTYPQYAMELALLSHELSTVEQSDSIISDNDRLVIDNAWKQYSSSSSGAAAQMVANLSVPELRELAKFLDVPRQVLTAFRERKVIVSSIPQLFLTRLADRLKTNIDAIKLTLIARDEMSYARSFKADEKPLPSAPTTFEQLLIDAQVPAEKRAKLMSQAD